MIIGQIAAVRTRDVPSYAWNRIAQFHNSEFTLNLISKLHNIEKKQIPNAKKQAEQIRHCLIQAQEYFNAARTVTLATRPVLLYYCVMSLALAEVLLKQPGTSRLDRLRAEHNCHGLTLGLTAAPDISDTFEVAASRMVAKVQKGDSGQAKGTFEVWRQSAREYPIGGSTTLAHFGAHVANFEILMIPEDCPPPVIGPGGVSLFDCIVNLPYMADILQRWGTRLQMVRSSVSRNTFADSSRAFLNIAVHPTDPDLLAKFSERFKCHSSLVNYIEITELPGSFVLKIDVQGGSFFSLPHATSISQKETFFSCSDVNLGEFGFLYAALHMLGNFARYYPDLWIKHIEYCSPLASVADELCRNAFDRLPLLTLSELTRQYHVLES